MVFRVFIFALLLKSAFGISEEVSRVKVETFLPSEMKELGEPYRSMKLDSLEEGQIKTVFWLEDLPKEGKIIFKEKREVLGDQKFRTYYSGPVDELTGGFVVISSRGYLPGEKVHYIIEVEDGSYQEAIEFIPHPFVIKNKKDGTKVIANLCQLKPTFYFMSFEGYEDREEIEMTTSSRDEKLVGSFWIGDGVSVCVDVLGFDGGYGMVEFKRKKNGQSIQLCLPWGVELLRYWDGERKPLACR